MRHDKHCAILLDISPHQGPMTVEIVLSVLAEWLHGSIKNKPIMWIATIAVLVLGFSLAFAEWRDA